MRGLRHQRNYSKKKKNKKDDYTKLIPVITALVNLIIALINLLVLILKGRR